MNIQVTKIVHERCFSPNSSCCTRHPIVLLAPCQRCLASVFAVTSWAAPWVTHKAVKCHYLGELVGGKKDLFSFDTKQLIFHRLACCKLSYACATAPINSSALFVLFCLFFFEDFFYYYYKYKLGSNASKWQWLLFTLVPEQPFFRDFFI